MDAKPHRLSHTCSGRARTAMAAHLTDWVQLSLFIVRRKKAKNNNNAAMCMLLQPQCIASKPSVKSIKHLDMKVCLERSSAPNINRLADDAKVMQMHALESAFGGDARSTGGCFVRCFPHTSRVRSWQHRLAFAYFMLLHRCHPLPAHRVSSLFDAGGLTCTSVP